MRVRQFVLFAGAVLLVLGFLFAYDLLSPMVEGPQAIPSESSEWIIAYRAPLDLLFPGIYYTVSWNSTETNSNLTVLGCGTDGSCAHPAATPVAFGHGPMGNVSFLGAANQYYLIRPIGGAMNVTVTYVTPLLGGGLGFAMVIGGAVLIAVGLTGRTRRPAPTVAPAEAPS